jgi:hypothetical protein
VTRDSQKERTGIAATRRHSLVAFVSWETQRFQANPESSRDRLLCKTPSPTGRL